MGDGTGRDEMVVTGFAAVLYYGIFASVTGGYVPYRVKNWWLVVFHLYLFLSFIVLPLVIYLVGYVDIIVCCSRTWS